MIKICEFFLNDRQIIISSTKRKLGIEFSKIINLENGVLKELEKFEINKEDI
nr:DUF2442 domain-containing protein [Fusobacterium gastrosuis]